MNLKIDDLLPFCKECEGTGHVENPVLRQNQNSFGHRVVRATPVDCRECNGYGVIPTEVGSALLEFLRRAKEKHLIN